jgi:hypothetical protein
MIAYGYVDITRTSSKQFVDLMNISDDLGVVSFGSTVCGVSERRRRRAGNYGSAGEGRREE